MLESTFSLIILQQNNFNLCVFTYGNILYALDSDIWLDFKTTRTISDASIACCAIFSRIVNIPCVNK